MNRVSSIVVILTVLVLTASCGKSTRSPNVQEPNQSVPANADSTAARLTLGKFDRLPPSCTGINFINRLKPEHPDRRLYHSGFVCGGVAIGDVNGDLLPDIYLVSGPEGNKLYQNLGDCRFRDITSEAGVDGGDQWGAGANMIDIDNDGDLDIYVCNYDAPNMLFVNDGRGHFVESASKWGLDIVDACLTATFQDYDLDGDLDVYLLNNRYYRKGGRPAKPPFVVKNGKPEVLADYKKFYRLAEKTPGAYNIDDYGRPDRFLRNDGQTFEEITATVGIAGTGYGLSATWWDYDSDGWPDLYVCNDFNDPDRLYHNNRDGTFTDVLVEALPHTPWFSMGSDAGDVNNDGLIDFLAVDMSATTHFKQKTTMGAMSAERLKAVAGPPPQYMRNVLYLNTGTGRCMEIAYLAGLANTDWSWAAKLADLDHDGRLDVFVSNGMVRNFNDSDVPFDTSMLVGRTRWDLYQHLPTRPEQNLAFKNLGDLSFEDVSRAWGLDHVGMSYGTALADLDGDRDLDLVVVNIDEPISVFRNNVADKQGLIVRLEGTESNRLGIGARLELETKSGVQVRYLNPASGFLSSNEPVVHFGLGDDEAPRRLTVDWPHKKGRRSVVNRFDSSGTIVVREADNTDRRPDSTAEPTLFVRAEPINFSHRETEFDDFALQPLLPNRLSQLGPGMAIVDIDQDGDEDAFVGGAAGQPGSVLFNLGDGRYRPRTTPTLIADAPCEDMGCLFLDADSDGDQDLYVVSGGVESHSTPELLQDRLYLNEGAGKFVKAAAGTLPELHLSGSVIATNDFDRDGDLDLFVGTRVVPGQYPLSGGSRLLSNEGGQFKDATKDRAAPLLACGMVTSAVWTDVDSDGWDDLAVTSEWGPVRIFQNEHGRLIERTGATTTQNLTGWYNGIAARDLDGDSDIDLVVTNFGLNTKYHATVAKPALLYYGDFDSSGSMRLVEAEYEDETLFPIRGKSCSTHAMPFLGEKYTSYHEFALADLNQLYTEQCLNESKRFAATNLASGVFVNEGDFRFKYKPLPRLAQVSPGFGICVTELNGDARPDIFLVHNFHGTQPETGNMDGGVSLLLEGAGDCEFTPVWPAKSGLVVSGDAKCLAMTDLNQDGLDDFVVGLNNDRPQSFLRRPQSAANLITVRLGGIEGNSASIGSRITVHLSNGSTQTAEVVAGSGYLTQSSPRLTFGTADSTVAMISVEWPDGKVSTHQGQQRRAYKIDRPAAQ